MVKDEEMSGINRDRAENVTSGGMIKLHEGIGLMKANLPKRIKFILLVKGRPELERHAVTLIDVENDELVWIPQGFIYAVLAFIDWPDKL